MPSIPESRDSRSALVAGAVIAVAITFVAGMLLGALLNRDEPATVPDEGSVDVGFSRDMREHHAQAVQMSVLVRDATDNREVRIAALDIMLTQQQQVGQMYGWLAAWGQPQSSPTQMAWMPPAASDDPHSGSAGGEHGSMPMDANEGGSMPGMASDEQLARLAGATGERAERMYLQLMIPHHKAGVMMAQYAAERAQKPQVRRLAQSIVDAQSAEIGLLRSMLADRGGPLGGV